MGIGTIWNDVMKEIEKKFVGNAKCYAVELCEEWEILNTSYEKFLKVKCKLSPGKEK